MTTPVTLETDAATQRAMAGGARPRHFGSWYIAEHRLRLMRAYLTTVIAGGIGSPVVYLFALGLGLGSLVGTVPGQNVSYVVFVAPALVASAAMMAGVEEFSFPVLAGFKWIGNFFGMNAAPISGQQIVDGISIAVVLRLTATSTAYYLILLLFNAVPNVWLGFLIIPLSVLTAMAFGLPVMAYASKITEDKGQFALIMRLIVAPMFLFSGTFFPLDSLPIYLQWIGWISPLWHGTQLGRVASYGMVEPLWLSIVHVIALVVPALIGWVLAKRFVVRRLNK